MPGTKFVAPPRSARVPFRRDIGFNLEHPTHLSFLFGKIIVAPRRTGDKKIPPVSNYVGKLTFLSRPRKEENIEHIGSYRTKNPWFEVYRETLEGKLGPAEVKKGGR